MTENEAIKEIKRWTEILLRAGSQCTMETAEAQDMAIKAIKEVQQYRAIGTPEELKAAMKYVYLAKKHGTVGQVIENCVKYEAIGTPEECRAAVEKQTAKKPDYEGDGCSDGQLVYDTWICPSCGQHYEVDYDDYDYCPECGQHIDKSMEQEGER